MGERSKALQTRFYPIVYGPITISADEDTPYQDNNCPFFFVGNSEDCSCGVVSHRYKVFDSGSGIDRLVFFS